MISDLRSVTVNHPDFPPVVLAYMGSPRVGQGFFKDRWPEVRAIADAELRFYDAFGIKRGGLKELVGPGVIAASARAMLKGNLQGRTVGDPYILPGGFLVQGDEVLWEHRYSHAGDHPDWLALPSLTRQLQE